MQKNAQATEHQGDSAHPNNDSGSKEQQQLEKGRELLARRLRSGERSAAAELVDRYYDRIYMFMRVVGHDRQVSEDLTQETFLRAWYHIGQLRDGKALSGWLYRIAGNVSKVYWRKHKGKDVAAIDETDVPSAGESEFEKAQDREQVAQLRAAVAGLPWKLKQAVVLHYMQNLTIAEAAEAAGVREGTLKSRLNRALGALRNRIS